MLVLLISFDEQSLLINLGNICCCYHFDFIFIDGWHSVNHVLKEWRFVEYLSDFGIVAIHDTNYHPGPRKFIKVLNPERYIIDKTCTEGKDWGISFIKKR